MTNEERQQAIEWLKRRPVTMAGAKKMFALAVEALEAYVPDTNVGDMISRQAAIDAAKHAWAKGLEPSQYIEILPLIHPKHGHWILDRSGAYCCSECMEPCATYVMMRPRDRFCKMCGADMRGGKNGTD